MKKIALIAILLAGFTAAIAYVNTVTVMRKATPQNVRYTTAQSTLADTLVGSGSRNRDTGYAWAFTPDNKKTRTVNVLVTQLTGSITATSMKLQGCLDTSGGLLSANWRDLTGVTALCAACVGASSTTVPGSSLNYTWIVHPNTHNMNFIRVVGDHTGTFTATYLAKLTEND